MKLASLFGHELKKLINTPDSQWVLPDCIIGVEIEVEDVLNVWSKEGLITRTNNGYRFLDENLNLYWELHIDNSLRNYGIELVSGALFGTDLVRALDLLDTFMKEYKDQCKFSYRCGTHIHIDVRDMDKNELLSFIVLYLLFEESLFDLWGESRKNNLFCVPFFMAEHMLDDLGKVHFLDREEEITSILSNYSNDMRYSGLNINALLKYGSLEFRHGFGTADNKRISEWINIIMSLKKAALGQDPEKLLESITERRFEDVARNVFGDLYNIIFPYPDFGQYKQTIYQGKRVAKQLLSYKYLNDYTLSLRNLEYGTLMNISEYYDLSRANPILLKFINNNKGSVLPMFFQENKDKVRKSTNSIRHTFSRAVLDEDDQNEYNEDYDNDEPDTVEVMN